MRSTDARSAQIDRPAGVTRSFQVSLYKVKPTEPSFACNLLAKDNVRAADLEEVEPVWPEVPLISVPISSACLAERLARARAGPDRSIVGPPGTAQGVTPHPDARKEVILGKIMKLPGGYVSDVSFIYYPRGDMTGAD